MSDVRQLRTLDTLLKNLVFILTVVEGPEGRLAIPNLQIRWILGCGLYVLAVITFPEGMSDVRQLRTLDTLLKTLVFILTVVEGPEGRLAIPNLQIRWILGCECE
jgi:hypothetical protein